MGGREVAHRCTMVQSVHIAYDVVERVWTGNTFNDIIIKVYLTLCQVYYLKFILYTALVLYLWSWYMHAGLS